MGEMEELKQEMAELAHNSQQLLYSDGVFTRVQLTQAVARLADVVSKLCSAWQSSEMKDTEEASDG